MQSLLQTSGLPRSTQSLGLVATGSGEAVDVVAGDDAVEMLEEEEGVNPLGRPHM